MEYLNEVEKKSLGQIVGNYSHNRKAVKSEITEVKSSSEKCCEIRGKMTQASADLKRYEAVCGLNVSLTSIIMIYSWKEIT